MFVFRLQDGVTSHINAEIHGGHNLMKAARLPTSEGWITCRVAGEFVSPTLLNKK